MEFSGNRIKYLDFKMLNNFFMITMISNLLIRYEHA